MYIDNTVRRLFSLIAPVTCWSGNEPPRAVHNARTVWRLGNSGCGSAGQGWSSEVKWRHFSGTELSWGELIGSNSGSVAALSSLHTVSEEASVTRFYWTRQQSGWPWEDKQASRDLQVSMRWIKKTLRRFRLKFRYRANIEHRKWRPNRHVSLHLHSHSGTMWGNMVLMRWP